MLLVEITINAVVFRVSIDGHVLTHNWRPRIIGFDAPQLNIPCDYGGYAQLTYGSILFNPVLFENDWPPPVSCAIGIYYTDTTEEARETVFAGTAHLTAFDRTSVSYALYGPSYDETIAAGTAYNNTLNVVLTTILTTIPEITTVNTTYARVTSPNVTYTTAGEQLAIDLASNIAAYYSHLIYVEGSTAYLVDMKRDNGNRTLTEFKFFAVPQYSYNSPIALLTCDYSGTQYQVESAYSYGSTESVQSYHTTKTNIETALADLLATVNAPRISFDMPMIAGNFPHLGEKIIIPDKANVKDLSSWIRARKLSYDFMNDCIKIEGEGAIAA
jgi:hypothetical protein